MFELIEEKGYRQAMESVVEPALAALCREIAVPVSGGTLHARAYETPGARAACVVLHGYTESCEKFKEMIWYLVRDGFAVYTYDHRGHGRSVRAVEDTSITHVDHFEDYLRDMERFMEAVVLPKTGELPRVLYAHSMGGAIGALALMEHPDWFARAVLTAPMIAASSAPFPRRLAKALAGAFCLAGKAKERAFVGKPFDPASETFENSFSTGRARFDYYEQKRVKNAHLQNCSPSYGWLRESLGVTDRLLRKENTAKITAQVLLCQAGLDTIVLLPEQERFVRQVALAQLKRFEGAKHEIYGSHDAVMREYVPAVLSFLKG